MADKELGGPQFCGVNAACLHETHGAVDVTCDRLILLIGRVVDKALVPAVNLSEVCKASGCEGANQVQGAG